MVREARPRRWHDEAFRDPWVFADPAGDGWHMLVTARARTAIRWPAAWSARRGSRPGHWELRPPLSKPASFGQTEVFQYVELDGVPHLVFSCGQEHLHPTLHPRGQRGGIWLVAGTGIDDEWDLGTARRVDHPGLYAARVIEDVDGTPRLLGFDGGTPESGFVGSILDPVPIDFEE